MSDTLTIAARFRGPPSSGNGGYVGGRLAQRVDGAVEVTFCRPVPLERSLAIETDRVGLRLLDGAATIAEARTAPLARDLPAPPAAEAIMALPQVGVSVPATTAPAFGAAACAIRPDGRCWRRCGHRLLAALTAGTACRRRCCARRSIAPAGLAVLADKAASALTGRMHAEVDDDVAPGEPYRVVVRPLGGEAASAMRAARCSIATAGRAVRVEAAQHMV
jgi:hypothetical protein